MTRITREMIQAINEGVYTDISKEDIRAIREERLNKIIEQSTLSYRWNSIPYMETKVADYKTDNFVDGPGVRNVLYVTYCPFACEECYNESIQDYRNGFDYTDELQALIIADLGKAYIQGLSLLGGEPTLNAKTLLPLVEEVRQVYGETKDIWMWTGYLYETLNALPDTDERKQLLQAVDVVVDGQYIKEYRDEANPPVFRGSSNQRIIDVKQSVATNQVVELTEYYKP
ncbi:anaerobic ribonucleoside-triphosphate reductase activating protein [Suicoccus acidiformans]|nr:anaerobic ribonucleoside-triphosphate reductase activating protein [Suicoccus acidiformans]